MDVSVVIPTRDRPDLLALTLRTVLWQECVETEILVVDDGDEQRRPNWSVKWGTLGSDSCETAVPAESAELAIRVLRLRMDSGSRSWMTTTCGRHAS
jgi:hypothetical protein